MLLTLLLAALACDVNNPQTWTPSAPQATAIELNATYRAQASETAQHRQSSTPEPSRTPAATQTPTASPTSSIVEVTPCGEAICEIPTPAGKQYRTKGLPVGGTHAQILGAYYAPSPSIDYGYLTRYGSNEYAAGVAVLQLGHFREQMARNQPLLGGNYGPGAQRDGQWAYGDDAPALTPAQWRLLDLANRTEDMSREEAIAMMLAEYDYIVAMKSPNDIGRMFCVFDDEGKFEGRAFVGDTSALNDYTGIGGTGGIPLGYRVTASPAGHNAYWLADVPTELWNRTKRGDNAWAKFEEECEILI